MSSPSEKRQTTPPGDEPSGPTPVARFGLTVFFCLAARAPWLAERLKPLFVRVAYLASPGIRHATLLNAAALGVPGHRQYALTVLCRFYDVVVDIARSGSSTHADLRQKLESVQGRDGYVALRASGCGAIVLTAHAGSFEVGLAALSELEPHVHVVFKRDRFSQFERSRQRLRQVLGVIESPVDDGPGIWITLRDALRQNHVVAVQGDRTPPGQKGMPMPIRGGTLLLPTGPFKLALASGSPIVPIFSARTPSGRVALFIKPAITVTAGPDAIVDAVAAYARALDRFLAEYPDQWLVLEPAFAAA